jgi:basic amino acid/polyamine antiporter, APA family
MQNSATDKTELKRVIGLTTAILLVAGNIIGTGVFKKIVPMAQSGLSEKMILAAWIVAGIITIFGAFSVAGLAKLTSVSGGAVEYLRICFGDLTGFLFGWGYFTILGSGSIAAVAFIFSQSLNSLVALPDPLHQWKDIAIGSVHPFADSGIKLLAVLVIGILTWFNYRGTKNAAGLNNVVTSTKILGIILLIVLGLFFAHAQTGAPVTEIISKEQGFSFAAFFGIMLSAFWAYDGFVNLGAISGEIINPKKNIPVAIITGVMIVLVLYVTVNYAYMNTLSLDQLAAIGENKVAAIVVAENILGDTGTVLISSLILLSTFGYLNAGILVFARYYYRMAQENLFFKKAARVHPVYRTPHVALFYSMIWSCILVMSGTFDLLTDMVVFGAFAFYCLLAIGLIKMKMKGRVKEKIPCYPVAPILFILLIGAFLVSTLIDSPVKNLIGIGLILSGMPFYYFFKKNSRNHNAGSEKQEPA